MLFRSKSHEIGLYLIKNRNNGEKQFFYWRDNSAAKNYFNNIDFVSLFKNLRNFDYIYFSGITLSIIDPSKISNFVNLLKLLKNKKVKIIFDFNIRINRWTKKNLNNFLHSILNFVDICFVSGEDLKFWKNDNSLSNRLLTVLNGDLISQVLKELKKCQKECKMLKPDVPEMKLFFHSKYWRM